MESRPKRILPDERINNRLSPVGHCPVKGNIHFWRCSRTETSATIIGPQSCALSGTRLRMSTTNPRCAVVLATGILLCTTGLRSRRECSQIFDSPADDYGRSLVPVVQSTHHPVISAGCYCESSWSTSNRDTAAPPSACIHAFSYNTASIIAAGTES